MNDRDIKNAYTFGNILLNITKWVFLLFMIISTGFTLGLIVFICIYGNKIPMELINTISSLFLSISSDEVNEIISTSGINNLLVSVIGYGIAISLTKLMHFILIDRTISLYKNVSIGDLFTRTSNKLVDEMMAISFIATFTTPLIIFVISLVTHIDLNDYVNVGYGCLFVYISLFILRIILNRGIDVTREVNKYERVLNDYKADIDELKIQSIKRDAELRKLKTLIKEQEDKLQQKEVKKKKNKPKKTTSK